VSVADQEASTDSMAGSIAYVLGKLGQIAATRLAGKLAPAGIKPRHCAVLEIVSTRPLSQLELAQRVGVTASVVVDMLDELESLDAVRRLPDAADRRRRRIELTETGQRLRQQANRAAREVDAELLTGLPHAEREAVSVLLTRLGVAHGLPLQDSGQ
jgi:DNA-binding MarR family transcriptional regulator